MNQLLYLVTEEQVMGDMAKQMRHMVLDVGTVIGFVIIFIGLVSAVLAIHDIQTYRPSGRHWTSSVFALVIGGIMTQFPMSSLKGSRSEAIHVSSLKGAHSEAIHVSMHITVADACTLGLCLLLITFIAMSLYTIHAYRHHNAKTQFYIIATVLVSLINIGIIYAVQESIPHFQNGVIYGYFDFLIVLFTALGLTILYVNNKWHQLGFYQARRGTLNEAN